HATCSSTAAHLHLNSNVGTPTVTGAFTAFTASNCTTNGFPQDTQVTSCHLHPSFKPIVHILALDGRFSLFILTHTIFFCGFAPGVNCYYTSPDADGIYDNDTGHLDFDEVHATRVTTGDGLSTHCPHTGHWTLRFPHLVIGPGGGTMTVKPS